ncbi:MAG TPA: LAGLIDADG family homing endonuclease [Nitrososphaerales archaeon]|nr:LAGLIDADG family homing endonuclease [Nitrososphaerales archaeon]
MAVLTKGLSELFEEFLRGFEDKDGERKYQVILAQMAASGRKSVIVDYEDLIHFNTDLAESLMKDPDKALKECRSAAFEVLSTENPGYAGEIRKSLTIRLRGVTDRVNLRKVDTSHLDKMIAFAGMLVRTSELRPLLVDAAFVCPDGHTTRVIQEGPSIKKPAKCEGCDETRNFELDQKDSAFIDSQILRVQELPEELPPGQLPRFFDIDVEGDIVNTARPGDRAIMTGIVRAEQDFAFGIPRSRSFRSKIDANYIEVVGKEPSQVHITKEDEAIIKSIAAGPDAYQKLIKSMAPGILGHEAVKEAILLLLVGGPQTILPDGTKLRGDINVFLVGDPGVAKSEMLKFAAQVAPRGMFASGRGSTAAGLSAAVIREKNTLMLEAGVVVLADQGIACIDEFDKMKPEDRSALHEQMEQQSYHPSTEVLLSSGKVRIGDYVEEAIRGHPELVEPGKDCEILRVSPSDRIFSVNLGSGIVEKTAISNLSRHRAPNRFVKATFSNGRSILVTPEHPIFAFCGAGISTIPAEKLQIGSFIPGPTRIPNSSMAIALAPVTSSKLSKKITQPASLTLKTARILGYLVTEGNFYVGATVEVDFTNLDERLLAEMRTLTRDEFGFEPTIRVSGGRKAGLRYLSTTLHAWFSENFPEMVCKARSKRAPAKILSASVAHINEFLTAAFLGDGGVETDAVCYRTASRGLAEDYQDLLLKLEIASRIVADRSNDSFKVYITGDSLHEFLDRVVDPLDHRRDRIQKLVDRSSKNNRGHDVLPTGVAQTLIQLLEDAGMSYDGYFWRHLKSGNGITKSTVERLLSRLEDRRRTVLSLSAGRRTVKELRAATGWSQERLAKECGVKRGAIEYLERGGYGSEQAGKLAETISGVINERFASLGESIEFIRGIMGLRFLRVTKVESVLNEGRARTEWVYDVTVEPRHNFVSAGIVLHNTVTIAKGGIYATLNARTAILAATNPILGKYNPYQNLIDNITLPIPLLTRFDLIFVLRDTPIPGQDEKLATHILDVHRKRAYVEAPPIQFELLKKYIAFAKNYSPVLTMEAENRIKEYYLQLRRSASEGQIGATPRTLESLIRLASAKARLMLREEVTEDDALTAISLMNKMVEDVLTDTETKTKGDFGILLGQPAGERGKLATVMDTLRGLEGPDRKPIEAKLFRQELMKTNKFANEDEVDNLIKKITKEGIIFESKPGFFRRVQG